MRHFVVWLLFFIVATSIAYSFKLNRVFKVGSRLHQDFQNDANIDLLTKIRRMISDNNVVLFMKGEKERPMCGFSDTACRVLNSLHVEFESVNVLKDSLLRSGIKEFSNWPTIPQLYVGGELVGGSDIMTEMLNSGELAKLLLKQP